MMKGVARVAAGAAIAVAGLGAGAASASAYSISGGAFTGVAMATQTASVGGAYTVDCGTAAFTGVATGAGTVSFLAGHDECTFFGHPAQVQQSGSWEFTIDGGPVGGAYSARVDIPVGASSTTTVPTAGCTVTVSGSQSFPGAASVYNVVGGVEISVSISGISYVASGCPFSSGSDLVYDSNGTIFVPGMSVS